MLMNGIFIFHTSVSFFPVASNVTDNRSACFKCSWLVASAQLGDAGSVIVSRLATRAPLVKELSVT